MESEDIYVVSVVRDFSMYNRCIADNRFLSGCKLCPIDNSTANDFIGVCYNKFLDRFDYDTPAWILFCREDWDAKEFLRDKIVGLDENSLWGAIGAVTRRRLVAYAQWRLLGEIEESDKDGSNVNLRGLAVDKGTVVDTFDRQCLIVHYTGTSSLLLGGVAPWWWRITVFAKRLFRKVMS